MNWQWNNTGTGKGIDNTHPGSHVRGWRLFVQIFVMLVIGSVFLYFRKRVPAILAFAMAFVMSVLGVFLPSVFSTLEQKSKKLGMWIAEKITWVVLTLVYFIFFVPGRLILVLMHKDTLDTEFQCKQTSYWRSCQKNRELTKYQKQY